MGILITGLIVLKTAHIVDDTSNCKKTVCMHILPKWLKKLNLKGDWKKYQINIFIVIFQETNILSQAREKINLLLGLPVKTLPVLSKAL